MNKLLKGKWVLFGLILFSFSFHSFASGIQNLILPHYASPLEKQLHYKNTFSELLKNDPILKKKLQKDWTLKPSQIVSTTALQTTKFQSFYKGIKVIGSNRFAHQNKLDGTQSFSSSGKDSRFNFFNTQPVVNMKDALLLAQSYTKRNQNLEAKPELQILAPVTEQDSAQLFYLVKITGTSEEPGSTLYINAQTGGLIAQVSSYRTIAPVDVYSAEKAPSSDIHQPTGTPIVIDLSHYDRVIQKDSISARADESAKRAHQNARETLDYYSSVHQRDSFDGKGSTVVSVVHIGKSFDNAFWSTDDGIMGYGDGDGKYTKDFTLALDIAGHEMTHGVVSQTANFTDFDEPGALNEALADFFGKMIENKNDWIMGKEIFVSPKLAKSGIRNLKNPHALKSQFITKEGKIKLVPQPASLKEKFQSYSPCDDSNDYCYVHDNSTIASHAAYKIYEALGKEKTETLIYNALVHFLDERTGFKAFSSGVKLACEHLFDSNTCEQVDSAFQAVGL